MFVTHKNKIILYELVKVSCKINIWFKVYESHSSAMVVNITTNKPVFHIRGLNAGTEYFVEIYSVNSNGISEHTIFETFTLQVNNNIIEKHLKIYKECTCQRFRLILFEWMSL